jgi:hypothetical protein
MRILLRLESATVVIWLFYRLTPTLLPGLTLFELTVGEAALDLSGQEIVDVFRMVLAWVSV